MPRLPRTNGPGLLGSDRTVRCGSILIVVLWILVLLIIFAAGIGRRAQMNTALAKYAAGEVRARFTALSAVRYAAKIIAQDSQDEHGLKLDTLYQCGFVLKDGLSAERMFKHVTVNGGYFDIINSWQRTDRDLHYGLSDEESRLNINAVTAADHLALKYLIMDAGVDGETAQTIAASVVDYIDADDIVFQRSYGLENDASLSDQPFVKNAPMQSLQELRLVNGMTPAIFELIKDHLTVFPPNGPLAVNINTASPTVLRSLPRNFIGVRTNTEMSDADSLVEKILMQRRGPDGLDGTSDDRDIESIDLRLGSRENSIMSQLEGYRVRVSNYLRFGVRSVDEASGVEVRAEAVVARYDGTVVYWQRVR